eukprot:4549212-Prymnesium_polylepis.1
MVSLYKRAALNAVPVYLDTEIRSQLNAAIFSYFRDLGWHACPAVEPTEHERYLNLQNHTLLALVWPRLDELLADQPNGLSSLAAFLPPSYSLGGLPWEAAASFPYADFRLYVGPAAVTNLNTLHNLSLGPT